MAFKQCYCKLDGDSDQIQAVSVYDIRKLIRQLMELEKRNYCSRDDVQPMEPEEEYFHMWDDDPDETPALSAHDMLKLKQLLTEMKQPIVGILHVDSDEIPATSPCNGIPREQLDPEDFDELPDVISASDMRKLKGTLMDLKQSAYKWRDESNEMPSLAESDIRNLILKLTYLELITRWCNDVLIYIVDIMIFADINVLLDPNSLLKIYIVCIVIVADLNLLLN